MENAPDVDFVFSLVGEPERTTVGLPADLSEAAFPLMCGASSVFTLDTFSPCVDLQPRQGSEAVSDPHGFAWTRRKNGEVIIEHDGRRAAVLRGRKAEDFVDDVAVGNEQEVMARATGNYKHGNERESRNHPRNR